MQETVYVGSDSLYLDFALPFKERDLAVISLYHSSEQLVRRAGAALVLGKGLTLMRDIYAEKSVFQVFYQCVEHGKQRVWHALAVNAAMGDKMFLTVDGNEHEAFFDYCMAKFDYPMLRDWALELFQSCNMSVLKKSMFRDREYVHLGGPSVNQGTLVVDGVNVPVDKLRVYEVNLEATVLEGRLSMLLKTGGIKITNETMTPLGINNLDSYFTKYGTSCVDNLKKISNPLADYDGEIENVAFLTKRLFPQQIALVNGVSRYLRKKKSAIYSCKMGTGKTILALATSEKLAIDKLVASGKVKDMKEAYSDPKAVNYTNLIVCPSHLVEKWKDSILTDVPYAKVCIISRFEQLVEWHKNGPKRDGKMFYIMSKDFMKLTYQESPAPKKIKYREVRLKKCANPECGVEWTSGDKCYSCDGTEYKLLGMGTRMQGLVCPNCDQILFPPKTSIEAGFRGDADLSPMYPVHFWKKTQNNTNCYYCGKELWEPYIKNIDSESIFKNGNDKKDWYRATFWSNASKKGKSTFWLLRGQEDYYIAKHGEILKKYDEREGGVRKYSPSLFIEKHMKGYIDLAIIDECHKMKGGGTAQGVSFHHLVNVAKNVLCLTGTLAGGKASDVFYLLFRLFPQKMLSMGYTWTGESKFCEEHGTVERAYEYSGFSKGGEYNQMSKGRSLSSPSVKPGISPYIFIMLHDSAVFLDIDDMSSHLPEFKEIVTLSDPETDGTDAERMMIQDYHRQIRVLTSEIKKKKGLGLIGAKTQFELSYLDKPYGAEDIKHPVYGDVVLHPSSYPIFSDENNLLSKEKKLIELVNKELGENRYMFIFAEFTGKEDKAVMPRLKQILLAHCGLQEQEIVILESDKPKAIERESYVHDMAMSGAKVFISNPRLVETGIDFRFVARDGNTYNYPTEIFYQVGTSLFVVMQASRRSYRLNQTEESRVYYMAVKGTKQQAVIQLLAEKQAASAVCEGKFSSSGLAALATATNNEVRLAQIMAEIDDVSENQLQAMFDVVRNVQDDGHNYKRMATFEEVVGLECAASLLNSKKASEIGSFSSTDALSLFGHLLSSKTNVNDESECGVANNKTALDNAIVENTVVVDKDISTVMSMNPFGFMGFMTGAVVKTDVVVKQVPEPVAKKKKKSGKITGTISLFDL